MHQARETIAERNIFFSVHHCINPIDPIETGKGGVGVGGADSARGNFGR